MSDDALLINEIFYSIQGESRFAGSPCVFVRLTGCHLRCRWCDTEYAFHEGRRMEPSEILDRIDQYSCGLVEITGGEPLLQPPVHGLMTQACDRGKTVLLETSGACSIRDVDPRVIRIMDVKCPDSGEMDRNLWENLDHLTSRDEVKFVVAGRNDYDWARETIDRHALSERCPISLSPVFGELELQPLAEWVLSDGLPVRVQPQVHKFIWDPQARGV
jgi:7-carboxy-7-deazaguanine synthase